MPRDGTAQFTSIASHSNRKRPCGGAIGVALCPRRGPGWPGQGPCKSQESYEGTPGLPERNRQSSRARARAAFLAGQLAESRTSRASLKRPGRGTSQGRGQPSTGISSGPSRGSIPCHLGASFAAKDSGRACSSPACATPTVSTAPPARKGTRHRRPSGCSSKIPRPMPTTSTGLASRA
jgi:hypothetical protein